ncbi:MAG: M50 family metallopeptidase [Bacteroidetes bacterium]|nr:M50 family metallopeptidase [Bacteroidota bacterium]MCL5026507.1 M50 family metallopeptidase [Chloroflexota bacterium]
MDGILSLIAFVLIFSVAALVHELGHFLVAKRAGIKVEEFGFGLPPRIFAVRRGETEYSLNLIPVLAFVRLLGEENPQEPRSFARATRLWRTGVLLAGPGMNLVLAVLLFASSFVAGWPTATATEVVVSQVTAGTPAEAAGLLPGDVILAAGGQPVTNSSRLRQVTETYAGKPMPLQIRRDGVEKTLTVNVRASWPEGQGPIGVSIGDRPLKIEPVPYPVGQALVMGAERTAWVIGITFAVPVLIVRGQLPVEMARPVSPVGIYQITGQITTESVETGWWFPILNWAGMLSAALGVTNVLPIPGLDGGRLIFVLLEAIRGRRVSPEREGLVHMIGMAVLLSAVAVVAYFEIINPIRIPGLGQ